MASPNFHTDHLPPEEKPKAEAELRWMVQETRREQPILPKVVAVVLIAAAFAAGILWERGDQLAVYAGAAVVGLTVIVAWLLARSRRRRKFNEQWEMAVLHWHAARAQIKEAVRKHDAQEAAEQAKSESKLRTQIMGLLRQL